jgi:uncharacterized protein (DUF2141 family)
MKKILIILSLSFSFFFIASAQDDSKTCTITVEMEGMLTDVGDVFVALFNKECDFLSNAYMSHRTQVKDKKATVIFKEVPPGTYGISVFHDENENGKMDTKMFGMPAEPTACSNGAVGRFGPPKWKNAKFEVAEEDLHLQVRLKDY